MIGRRILLTFLVIALALGAAWAFGGRLSAKTVAPQPPQASLATGSLSAPVRGSSRGRPAGASTAFEAGRAGQQALPQTTPSRPVSAPSPTPSEAPQQSLEVIGTFIAPDQTTLAFTGAGRIAAILVQEGQTVKPGDALARLDTSDAQLNVDQAQAGLAVAQARLDQVKAGGTAADVAAAQSALAAARQNYATVAAGPTADQLKQEGLGLLQAKAALDQAQAAYDQVKGQPNIAMLPQALALEQATNAYQAAAAAYNQLKTHPTAAELAQASAQVKAAQDALARLQPTAQDVTVAQAQVAQAAAALAQAKQQVADATLIAPIDGTVTWIGPHAGDSVGPTSPVLILADLSRLQFQAGVDQHELARVQVGQPVLITPTGFPNVQIHGTVSRIGSLATTTAGIVNVPVTIDLAEGDPSLRPGLSAMAEIQTN
jgi:multidrug resistance efflux pump